MTRFPTITALLVLAGTFTAAGAMAAGAAQTWDFQGAASGKLPPGWTEAKTGEGPGSVWQVLDDPTAPAGAMVLQQTSSEGPKPLFNLCVVDSSEYRDLELRVALKSVRGKIDQGGGLVWRYQDAKNYYVVRVNPLEANLRLYKVVDGKRVQLATADVEAPERQWMTLRVVHRGNRIECWLGDQQEFAVDDATIQQPGKIGLWTKADAVTSFDALTVKGR